jgi:hypothetical protein
MRCVDAVPGRRIFAETREEIAWKERLRFGRKAVAHAPCLFRKGQKDGAPLADEIFLCNVMGICLSSLCCQHQGFSL